MKDWTPVWEKVTGIKPKSAPMKKNQSKTKRVNNKDNFNSLCYEVGKYIEFKGGKALVIGGISVAQLGKFKYQLIIDFTGTPPTYNIKEK